MFALRTYRTTHLQLTKRSFSATAAKRTFSLSFLLHLFKTLTGSWGIFEYDIIVVADYEHILTEVRGKVGLITLNRPKARVLLYVSMKILDTFSNYCIHLFVLCATGLECSL